MVDRPDLHYIRQGVSAVACAMHKGRHHTLTPTLPHHRLQLSRTRRYGASLTMQDFLLDQFRIDKSIWDLPGFENLASRDREGVYYTQARSARTSSDPSQVMLTIRGEGDEVTSEQFWRHPAESATADLAARFTLDLDLDFSHTCKQYSELAAVP